MTINKKNIKNILLDIVIVCLFCIVIFCFYRVYQELSKMKKAEKLHEEVYDMANSSENDSFNLKKDNWYDLKMKNNDFIGWLQWNSGLISQPIVMTTNNKYYLTHNFYKEYFYGGTIFLDSNYEFSYDNAVIYGHSVFLNNSTSDYMFTPLHKLINQEELDKNSKFKIYWEDNISLYEISFISIVDTSEDSFWEYYKSSFTNKKEFNEWINYGKKLSISSRNININYSDKLVTLQTCYDNNSDKKIIVVAKNISTKAY